MDYVIKKFDFINLDKQLYEIARLQNIVYAKSKNKFTTDGFKFWYIDNPNGKVISFNAYLGDEIVAHYACIPIKMNISNNIVDGLLDIATVTHPNHRGKGLFRLLASQTFDYAKNKGYKFVLGVANENSFPGYMKYFPFQFISKLDVKWGIGLKNLSFQTKLYSVYWNKESISWRMCSSNYFNYKKLCFGTYKNFPFIKTFMGILPDEFTNTVMKPSIQYLIRPFNLYVGLGMDLSKGFYFNFPKFIKHSPFNLIFLDLTDGTLPLVNKDNIFFQLMDFDVA